MGDQSIHEGRDDGLQLIGHRHFGRHRFGAQDQARESDQTPFAMNTRDLNWPSAPAAALRAGWIVLGRCGWQTPHARP